MHQQLGLGRGSRVCFALMGDPIEVRPWKPQQSLPVPVDFDPATVLEEEDADAATQDQRQAARGLIESGQDLFLPKTVALELEWVLHG